MRFFPVLFLLAACSTPPPALDPALEYERDLVFTVAYLTGSKWSEPQKFQGGAVIKKAARYRIELFAPGQVDMMTLSSCHREIKTPSPEKSGGWFQAKRYVFEFAADELLESGKPCPLSLGVYDKEKGRNGWATLVVESDAKMQAELRCNGAHSKVTGTSFCQSRAGLLQVIAFDRPVEVGFYGACKLDAPSPDKKTFIFRMPRGACAFHFFDATDERNEHALHSFGYEGTLIRGVE